MTKNKFAVFLLLTGFLFLLPNAYSARIPFDMVNFGDDDVSSIFVAVEDIANNQVKVSVDVSGGPIIADITGVFFDLGNKFVKDDEVDVPRFDFNQKEGKVKKAPNGSNIGGNVEKFDVGVAVGESLGIKGGDDFQSVKFIVEGILGAVIAAADFDRIGVRLQSVGEIGSKRDGSAKYVGGPSGPPAAVPEPATMLLVGTGLIGLAGLGRKKLFRKN